MPQKVADALEKIARELQGALTPAERATVAEAIAALRSRESGSGERRDRRAPGKKKPGG